MPPPDIPSPEHLGRLLLLASKHSAWACDLMSEVPELVENICPQHRYPGLDLSARAHEAEQEIRAAIASFDDNTADFFTAVLGLDTTRRTTATVRFITAGRKYLGRSESTTKRGDWKAEQLLRLAFALYERLLRRDQ